MPYEVTRRFERSLGEYTGAPFVVCVNSCTAALQLAIEYCRLFVTDFLPPYDVEIPRYTYPSVPQAIFHAGCRPWFRDELWQGVYQLKPLPVWDCARRFTSGMYQAGQFQCVSFAAAKILGIEQGGAILHDNQRIDGWLRRMRFDGRQEGLDLTNDPIREIGHHFIMLPSIAAQGLLRLYHLPRHNADSPGLPDQVYPDVSRYECWR